MPKLIVRTFSNGKQIQGSPCTFDQSGYATIEELRKELHNRWEKLCDVQDIDGGVSIVPKKYLAENNNRLNWQEVTLEE